MQQPPYSNEQIKRLVWKEIDDAMGFLWKSSGVLIWFLIGVGILLGAIIALFDRAFELSQSGSYLIEYIKIFIGGGLVSLCAAISFIGLPTIVVMYGAGHKYGTLKYFNKCGEIPLGWREKDNAPWSVLYGIILGMLMFILFDVLIAFIYAFVKICLS